MNELSGRVAIVTGGSAGIGRGIVERFVQEGARVVVADVDRAGGEALATHLGPDVRFRRTDVADPDEVRDLVSFAVEEFGGLHVMVNNAGISGTMHAAFLDEDFADFSRIMSINVLGVMAGTQHAARHMADHGGGSVVNVTSIGGIMAGRGVLTYRASKAAVIQLSKSVAIDLAELGIRVNCIAPGGITTQLLGTAVPGEAVESIRARMTSIRPLPLDGVPADIAEAALYLGSDRSRYVTGIVLPVDGGTIAGNTMVPIDPAPARASGQR